MTYGILANDWMNSSSISNLVGSSLSSNCGWGSVLVCSDITKCTTSLIFSSCYDPYFPCEVS